MRKIKVRAWDKIEKTMLPFLNIIPMRWIYDGSLEDMFDNSTDDVEWMQYTGLKDKNLNHPKEVYEGDILEYITGARAVVEWSETYCGWVCKSIKGTYIWNLYESLSENALIIGNIWENTELLSYIK